MRGRRYHHAGRADGLLVGADPLFTVRRAQLVILATHHRLPAVYFDRVLTDIGGLMSYGANLAEQHRQVGVYVGRNRGSLGGGTALQAPGPEGNSVRGTSFMLEGDIRPV